MNCCIAIVTKGGKSVKKKELLKKGISVGLACMLSINMAVPTIAEEQIEQVPNMAYAEEINNESNDVVESDVEILHSGVSGDLEWKIDSNWKLTISGSGDYACDYKRDNRFVPGWCEYAEKISAVDFKGLNTSHMTSMRYMFYYCCGLKTIDLSDFDTSNVTDMEGMFYHCSYLETLDLRNFNTSNVTNMKEMFYTCTTKTLDLSNFDTSNVTDMEGMFRDCWIRKVDLSNFDISNVTNMKEMFRDCSGLKTIDLSNFEKSSVTSMNQMFNGCSNIERVNLSNFDASNVTDMSWMFWSCSSLKRVDLSNLNTPNLTNMAGMFCGCNSLTNLDLSNFDTSNVTDMNQMFFGCSKLEALDLNNFDTSNVIDMSHMFADCSSLKTLNLSSFDTSNIEDMASAFAGCKNLSSSITISSNVNSYTDCFWVCSTEPDSKFIVKYDKDCSKELAQKIVDTKREDSNVYLEGADIDEDSEYFVLNQDTNSFGHNLRSFYTVKRYVCKSDEVKNFLESIYTDTECVVDKDKFTKYAVRNAVHGNEPSLIKEELYWKDKDGNHEGVAYQEIGAPGANYRTAYLSRVLDGAGISGAATILLNVNNAWNGACYGVEASMVYNNTGDLIDVFGNQKYHDLGIPVENTQLRDVINFYYLCQYRSDYKRDYITYKGWKLLPGSNSVSLEEFLKELVNEAKYSKDSRKPFLLNYHEADGGHTVIVCGYQAGNITDHGNGYQLKIYDCNGYAKDYLSMFIPEDYSSFEFTDGNKVNVGEDWKDLSFVGVDTLKSAQKIIYNPEVSTLATRATNTDQNKVVITMSAYTPFKLTNASGEELSYDGETLEGSLKIYSSKILGESNAEMFLEVDPSESFTFTNIDDTFKGSAEINGQYYMAETVGADSISLSLDNGVVLDGDSYQFSSAITTDLNSCEMVKISGETGGNCALNTTDTGVNLDSENDCSDVWIETYSGTDYSKKEAEDSTKNILITDGNNGDTEIKIDDKPEAVTNLKATAVGKNKVKLAWTASKGAEGYLIYAQKDKKYGYCGMTSKTNYTDTKALDGDYNYYWVFAYVKDSNGKMIVGKTPKYVYAKGVCAAVTNLKAASQKGSVKLTWTKSNDAEGYLVYGKTESGKYGYIGMTSNTSYVDKKASKTEWNFYWVYPYYKNADGKMVVGQTGKYVYGKAK